MTFKLAVKTIAQKNGQHATFMPKPIFGISGIRDAYEYVPVPRRKKRVLRRKRQKRVIQGGTELYCRAVSACARNVRGYEPPCQFI